MMKMINKTRFKKKYRFEKNNFADDLFRKRNYENEIAKKKQK